MAKAHALTNPFGAGAAPFTVHATAVSSLALRGVGKGTYENQWVDAQHWQRIIRFPDFQQTEMRNDSGPSWYERSAELLPIRVMQVLRFVVIHLPGKKSVSSYAVSESAAVSDQGAPVTCYSATAAPMVSTGIIAGALIPQAGSLHPKTIRSICTSPTETTFLSRASRSSPKFM